MMPTRTSNDKVGLHAVLYHKLCLLPVADAQAECLGSHVCCYTHIASTVLLLATVVHANSGLCVHVMM